MTFLAPTISRSLRSDDVIVIRNFSGQNAGAPTDCFEGERPIFLARLFRKGARIPSVIEFIPVNKTTLKPGLKLTNFVSLGSCVLGPEAVPRFKGSVVSDSCGCKRKSKKPASKKRKAGRR